MMDFITIPTTIGICIFGFYKVLELFAKRKERMAIIDKLSTCDPEALPKLNFNNIPETNFTMGALRFGSLLIGLGLGLLIAFVLQYSLFDGGDMTYQTRDMLSAVYGSSTLIFGGIGLIIGFIIEVKMKRKEM